MINIESYMLSSREERTRHIDLGSPCIIRGGHRNNFRGILAQFLDTDFPNNRKINLCHACHNGQCSNALHLYWGWAAENTADQKENGTMMNLAARTKAKMGSDYSSFMSEIGRKGGKSPRKPKSAP